MLNISLLSLFASLILGSIVIKSNSVILKVLLSFIWIIILLIPVFILNPEYYLLFLLLIALCLVSYLFNDNLKNNYEMHGLRRSLYFTLYVMILSHISYTIFTEMTELSHKPDTLFFILFILILVLVLKNILIKDRDEYED